MQPQKATVCQFILFFDFSGTGNTAAADKPRLSTTNLFLFGDELLLEIFDHFEAMLRKYHETVWCHSVKLRTF